MTHKRILSIISARPHLAPVLSLVASMYVSVSAFAVEGVQNGADSARGVDQPLSLFGVGGTFTTITNVLLFIVGAIAVIMIIVGGMRYVLSGGDSNKVTAAKNTILYAIIGIVVAILAYAIVRFVIGNFINGGTSGGTNV